MRGYHRTNSRRGNTEVLDNVGSLNFYDMKELLFHNNDN